VEFVLLRFAGVDRGGDQDIASLGVHAPQAVAILDHSARWKLHRRDLFLVSDSGQVSSWITMPKRLP
jgi:hypothetical protein